MGELLFYKTTDIFFQTFSFNRDVANSHVLPACTLGDRSPPSLPSMIDEKCHVFSMSFQRDQNSNPMVFQAVSSTCKVCVLLCCIQCKTTTKIVSSSITMILFARYAVWCSLLIFKGVGVSNLHVLTCTFVQLGCSGFVRPGFAGCTTRSVQPALRAG